MPDATYSSSSAKANDDKKTSADKPKVKSDDQQLVPTDPISKPKEQEPESADTALKEIQEREKEASEAAHKEIQRSLGKEAGIKELDVEIPPDVEEAGVKSLEKEATEVFKKGATFELPITEEEYKEGEKAKLTAKVTQKREVYGVSSLIALAVIVGRMIKMAHHKMKKVVFKKGE